MVEYIRKFTIYFLKETFLVEPRYILVGYQKAYYQSTPRIASTYKNSLPALDALSYNWLKGKGEVPSGCLSAKPWGLRH